MAKRTIGDVLADEEQTSKRSRISITGLTGPSKLSLKDESISGNDRSQQSSDYAASGGEAARNTLMPSSYCSPCDIPTSHSQPRQNLTPYRIPDHPQQPAPPLRPVTSPRNVVYVLTRHEDSKHMDAEFKIVEVYRDQLAAEREGRRLARRGYGTITSFYNR